MEAFKSNHVEFDFVITLHHILENSLFIGYTLTLSLVIQGTIFLLAKKRKEL